MSSREYLIGTQEFDTDYSAYAERPFPVTAEHMLSLRREIGAIAHNLQKLGVTPERSIFTAQGYANSQGTYMNMETHVADKESRALACTIKFSDQHGGIFSYKLDTLSEDPNFLKSSITAKKATRYVHLPIQDTVFELCRHMPESDAMRRVFSKGVLVQPIDVIRALRAGATTDGMEYNHDKIFAVQDHDATTHDGIPFSTRTIVLEAVASDSDTSSQSRLTIASQPLSPADGLPIKDVHYGHSFTLSSADTTTSSVTNYGSAVAFGLSHNPLFDRDDLHTLIKPVGNPIDESERYTTRMLDTAKKLERKVIDASFDELLD